MPRWGLRSFLVAAALLAGPGSASAQYQILSPAGDTIRFERDRLLEMREFSTALREDLERDPAVLYYTAFGPVVERDDAASAFPWNAIEVVTDSLAGVVTPGNLREADRAYVNYAVLRMRAERADPDVPCDEWMGREVEAVEGFVVGWIVARTLFGGPPFGPLDELVFARAAGVLPGLIADQGDPHLRGCLTVWRQANPDAIRTYREWRSGRDAVP